MSPVTSSVTVIGNITKTPTLRSTSSGKQVTNFNVAENKHWTNPHTHQEERRTAFYSVTAWDSLAENICESLKTGDRVIIYGRLDMDSWTPPDSDESRNKVKIVAHDVGPAMRWANVDIFRNGQDDHADEEYDDED